ncbi:hypothetical protein Jiend_55730 [Micromonospora endophytica]|nr:hypothetical protein Jiend_55730 [Micromonospora endophytica]
MKDAVVASTSGRTPRPAAAVASRAANASAATTAKLCRGTSPATLPRLSQPGSAPSRPSAAPNFAAPA